MPLGVLDHDGNATNEEMTINAKIKSGNFTKLELEVDLGGNKNIVAEQNGQYAAGHTVAFKWDGFVNDVYDSAQLTDPNGITFTVIGYDGGSETARVDRKLTFKYDERDWIDVLINRSTRRIDIFVRIEVKDGGAQGLNESGDVPPSILSTYGAPPITSQMHSYQQMEQYALQGVKHYWSRNVSNIGKNIIINGIAYEVFTEGMVTSDRATPAINLIYRTNMLNGRSHNWELSRITYFNEGYLDFSAWGILDLFEKNWGHWSSTKAVDDFTETFAHELGHELLKVYGGHSYSKEHKGSSTLFTQTPKNGTVYPSTGEIDLMKYADSGTKDLSRVVASNEDVKGLIWISGIEVD